MKNRLTISSTIIISALVLLFIWVFSSKREVEALHKAHGLAANEFTAYVVRQKVASIYVPEFVLAEEAKSFYIACKEENN